MFGAGSNWFFHSQSSPTSLTLVHLTLLNTISFFLIHKVHKTTFLMAIHRRLILLNLWGILLEKIPYFHANIHQGPLILRLVINIFIRWILHCHALYADWHSQNWCKTNRSDILSILEIFDQEFGWCCQAKIDCHGTIPSKPKKASFLRSAPLSPYRFPSSLKFKGRIPCHLHSMQLGMTCFLPKRFLPKLAEKLTNHVVWVAAPLLPGHWKGSWDSIEESPRVHKRVESSSNGALS